MIEPYYTTEQVAKLLQVHPFTVLKFIKQGKLKGVKIGRVYRIQESDVKMFLEERITQPKQSGQKKQASQQPAPSPEEQLPQPPNGTETQSASVQTNQESAKVPTSPVTTQVTSDQNYSTTNIPANQVETVETKPQKKSYELNVSAQSSPDDHYYVI